MYNCYKEGDDEILNLNNNENFVKKEKLRIIYALDWRYANNKRRKVDVLIEMIEKRKMKEEGL